MAKHFLGHFTYFFILFSLVYLGFVVVVVVAVVSSCLCWLLVKWLSNYCNIPSVCHAGSFEGQIHVLYHSLLISLFFVWQARQCTSFVWFGSCQGGQHSHCFLLCFEKHSCSQWSQASYKHCISGKILSIASLFGRWLSVWTGKSSGVYLVALFSLNHESFVLDCMEIMDPG